MFRKKNFLSEKITVTQNTLIYDFASKRSSKDLAFDYHKNDSSKKEKVLKQNSKWLKFEPDFTSKTNNNHHSPRTHRQFLINKQII